MYNMKYDNFSPSFHVLSVAWKFMDRADLAIVGGHIGRSTLSQPRTDRRLEIILIESEYDEY